MHKKIRKKLESGVEALQRPILPLAKIVQLLFFTAPFEKVSPILDELVEPVETESITYQNPPDLLLPYLPFLQEIEILKQGGNFPRLIIDEEGKTIPLFEAVDLWLAHSIVSYELEKINSLLCGPCGCDLCCVGPDDTMTQEFFEIPLSEKEVKLYNLPQVDNEQSHSTTAYTEPPLKRGHSPFYEAEMALYHWQTGWSMILPRNSVCPQLDPKKRGCTIYPQRPDVCRRPQVFCYVLERHPELDKVEKGKTIPAYMHRNKLLAIMDCPYVQELQDEIANYAALCDLEILFKKNKQ